MFCPVTQSLGDSPVFVGTTPQKTVQVIRTQCADVDNCRNFLFHYEPGYCVGCFMGYYSSLFCMGCYGISENVTFSYTIYPSPV